MKIALIIPPAWSIYMPPLGAAYIASAMRKSGHDVDVFDYNVEVFPQIHIDQNELWERKHLNNWTVEDKFEATIKDKVISLTWELFERDQIHEKYDVIAFSTYTTSFLTTQHILGKLRDIKTKCKLVVGGPSITIGASSHWFRHGLADAGVIGEGEDAICALLDRFSKKKPFDDLAGVITTRNFNLPPTPKLINMKDLVIPNFSDFDLQKYNEKSLPIQMSRGCTAACSFCSETYMFRSRPPEDIIKEFKLGFEKFGNTYFNVSDSLINSSTKFIREVCLGLVKENLPIKWGGNARLDKFLTPEVLELMAKAGCHYLSFGLESGSNKVLKLMRKGIRIEFAEEVLRNTHKAGIIPSVNILIGFPGEEEEDFQLTMDFLERNKDYIDKVSTGGTLGIGFGSHLYKKPEKYNVKTSSDNSILYDDDLGWVTTDGRNTEPVRFDRLRRLQEFLSNNNMNY